MTTKMNETGQRANATRSLTRSLDSTEEGLAMQATHRKCPVCDGTVVNPPTGRPRTFCSRTCLREERKRAGRQSRLKPGRACQVCGTGIDSHARSDTKFCSARCMSEAHSRRRGRVPVASAAERFWSRVDKTEAGCWEWTGAMLASGYGSLRVNNRAVVVHRFSWELNRGPIPEGLQVDHLCRNRACCNPDHLEPVSQQENLRRARDHKRAVALITGVNPMTTTPKGPTR